MVYYKFTIIFFKKVKIDEYYSHKLYLHQFIIKNTLNIINIVNEKYQIPNYAFY